MFTATNSIGITMTFATMQQALEWAKSHSQAYEVQIHDETNNVYTQVRGTR